ncbi:MAG: hypothetical protein UY21_C0001G0112 [Microgenomates group bacterium GW2011_GWA1_48_10]|nr:MAG: hypothetical protein UY21_C0001G0112 [Microgenomates group bacterium GW2011_GWA1_48_10]
MKSKRQPEDALTEAAIRTAEQGLDRANRTALVGEAEIFSKFIQQSRRELGRKKGEIPKTLTPKKKRTPVS